LKILNKVFSALGLFVVALSGCGNPPPSGIAPFVYMAELEDYDYKFIEYYPNAAIKSYVNMQIPGVHYRNAYYDGQKLYLSMSHTFFIYDSITKKVKELPGIISNAIKKINGDVWLATDNGLSSEGYSSSLCKINVTVELECLYEINNQQIDDFYIDFDNEVFYGSGAGVSSDDSRQAELKVVEYNMRTGEETVLQSNGRKITSQRLANICPGQFVTDDGDVYMETGEKISEVFGTKGKKLQRYINDAVKKEAAFLDYDNNLLEVYGCRNDEVTHLRTIILENKPSIYPVTHSWETTDSGEISMPIRSEENTSEYLGFQSINLRTGEVQVYLFDEPVYKLHAVARFV